MLKNVCNANDVLTKILLQCRPDSHMLSLYMLRVKKSTYPLHSRLKLGWKMGTLNAIDIDAKYSHSGQLVNTSINSIEKRVYQLKLR